MNRNSALLAGLALASASAGQYSGAKPVPPAWRTGASTITLEKAKALVGALAGADFLGRDPQTGSFGLAAGWVAAQLQAAGLKPAGDDGSYFQRLTLTDTTAVPTGTRLRTADGSLNVAFGSEFSCTANEKGSWKVPGIAFVQIPANGDWSTLDLSALAGKWVFLSPSAAANGAFRRRLAGREGGARVESLAVVVDNGRKRGDKVNPARVRSLRRADVPLGPPVAAVSMSGATMAALANLGGAKNFLDTAATKVTVELSDMELFVDTDVTTREWPTVNVLAEIPGSDPVLSRETVIIGSHLDHLGTSSGDVFYGADDNGSGCTANLMIAQAFAANPTKPKRTVRFAFWTLEEMGLLGSRAYVDRKSFDPGVVAAYFNMDMVGRNENDPRFKETASLNTNTVYPSGVAFNSPDFLSVLFQQNEFVGLVLKPDVEDRIMRSDSGSFAGKGIPTVKVFTGDHEDYHKPTDTPEKVNYEKLTNIAKWLFLTAEELATDRARPRWQPTPFKPLPWPDPRKSRSV